MLVWSTAEQPIVLQRSTGLFTPPGAPAPVGNFRLSVTGRSRAVFLTLMLPHFSSTAPRAPIPVSAQGDGEVWRIPGGDGEETRLQVGVNRGDRLAAAEWETDARVVVLARDGSGAVQQLLLEEGSYFRTPSWEAQLSQRASLWLSRNGAQWLGYLQAPDPQSEVVLSLRHFPAYPLRFNHRLVRPTAQREGWQQFGLQGSGSLELGSGPERVYLPYRFIRRPDLLVWLASRPGHVQTPDRWRDDQRQQAQNEVVVRMSRALDRMIGRRTGAWTGDSLLVRNALNLVGGLLQESYNNQNLSTLRIPHRYRLNGTGGNLRWQAMEEGIFTERSVRIHNLHLGIQDGNGRALEYRMGHWLAGQFNHSLRLSSGAGNWLLLQHSRFRERRAAHVSAGLRMGEWQLNPGWSWQKGHGSQSAFLNWRRHRLAGSLWRSRGPRGVAWYQSLSGYGTRWAFSLQGRQNPADQQDYTLDGFFRPAPTLTLDGGFQLQKNRDWQMEGVRAQASWVGRELGLTAQFQRRQGQWQQQGRLRWHSAGTLLLASLRLTEWRIFPGDAAGLFLENGLGRSRLLTQVAADRASPGAGVAVRGEQQWQIPAGSFQIAPLWGLQARPDWQLNRMGSGLWHGSWPLYVQGMRLRQAGRWFWDWQFNMALPVPGGAGWATLWAHLRHRPGSLEQLEVYLQPPARWAQPGIYASYQRNLGTRLEGFVQIRW
ncbi:MAG: hypothetical protein D6715_05860 [Calditrichaeota bacterium]|nr:MAG: hypothetical protein D6715_05860 [Calditrichota bacterium]